MFLSSLGFQSLKKVKAPSKRHFRPRGEALERRELLATLLVDDDGRQFRDADYATIQEAVNAADPGDTIRVAAGRYEESVNVDKELTILGAQSNKDQRFKVQSQSKNSVVEVPAGGAFGFNLDADNIVLKGFIIQDSNDDGVSPVGVITTRDTSGSVIARNVIQSNTFGIYLNSNGEETTVVEDNLIRDNNQAGSASGNGIYSDQGLSNAEIEGNRFTGHVNASIILVGGGPLGEDTVQSDIEIQRNVFIDDASIILTNTTDSEISFNVMEGSNGSGVFLGGGVSDLVIRKNVLVDGEFTAINLRTNTFGNAAEPNSDIDIIDNVIAGWGDTGIRLSAGANDITVRGNRISGTAFDGISLEDGAINNLIEKNRLDRNGRDGIRVDATSVDNRLIKNKASRNGEHDYHDDSTGSGTAGTGNEWSKNEGKTQNRPGLISKSKKK